MAESLLSVAEDPGPYATPRCMGPLVFFGNILRSQAVPAPELAWTPGATSCVGTSGPRI